MLPALELLHFWPGLEANVRKIAEYYEKAASSDVFDSVQKTSHIHKFGGCDVYDKAMQHAEKLYKECYLELNGAIIKRTKEPTKTTAAYGKISQLLRELSDDSDDKAMSTTPSTHRDPHCPWLKDFHGYLNLKDQLA
ncbi:hypothetical protein EV363DRAFT_1445971 [Boletus edulis]|nr:hypothetical protein EV363DRAFT_1445971 [Boletus edulis]